MAWLWWLLAPVASTGIGAVIIWWRGPTGAGRRLRRTDAVSEHQALLRALGQHPSVGSTPVAGAPSATPATAAPGTTRLPAAEQPAGMLPLTRASTVGQPVTD